MTVGVLTDSAAALPPTVARQAGVEVQPIWLHVDGRVVLDGQVAVDEVLAASRVTTSGPSPGEWSATIARLLDGHDRVLVLTVASGLSATFQSARLGAEPYGERVRVVDTATAAGGQGLVAVAAGQRAGTAASLDEVDGAARAAMGRVRVVGSLTSFEHLVRSGRVPGVAAWAAERLHVRPLFELRDGAARPLRPVRGEGDADRFVELCRREQRADAALHAAVMHVGADERAEKLRAALEAELAPASVFTGPFGPGMVAHTGPGLLGLAWWWEVL